MRYFVKVECVADVAERWAITIPDDTPKDQIQDALWNALTGRGDVGRADFIDQDVSGEHDREIVEYEEYDR